MNGKELLKEYQETGLTPAQINEIMTDWCVVRTVLNEYKSLGSLDYLKNLVENDKEGRCELLRKKKAKMKHIIVSADGQNLREVLNEFDRKVKQYNELGFQPLREITFAFADNGWCCAAQAMVKEEEE